MSNLIHATITIPEDIYTQARIVAAYNQTSFSQFVSNTLKNGINIQSASTTKDPFRLAGSLHLGVNRSIRRNEIYDDKLRKKMGY